MKTIVLGLLALFLAVSAYSAEIRTSVTLAWEDTNDPALEVNMYEVSAKKVEDTIWKVYGKVPTRFFKFTTLSSGLWHFTVKAITARGVPSDASVISAAVQVNSYLFVPPSKLSSTITNEVVLP